MKFIGKWFNPWLFTLILEVFSSQPGLFVCCPSENWLCLKWIVHPKITIFLPFAHIQKVLNIYGFLSFVEHKKIYCEECWKKHLLPSIVGNILKHTVEINGCFLLTFFITFSFVFNRRIKLKQVCDKWRMSKCCQNCHFRPFWYSCKKKRGKN